MIGPPRPTYSDLRRRALPSTISSLTPTSRRRRQPPLRLDSCPGRTGCFTEGAFCMGGIRPTTWPRYYANGDTTLQWLRPISWLGPFATEHWTATMQWNMWPRRVFRDGG